MKLIKGFLIDEPIADHFRLLYPQILDYYNTDLLNNQYGFGFKKDENGNALLNEFNQYLSNVNLTELYIKWNVENTTNVTIDILIRVPQLLMQHLIWILNHYPLKKIMK